MFKLRRSTSVHYLINIRWTEQIMKLLIAYLFLLLLLLPSNKEDILFTILFLNTLNVLGYS
jgi:hypothetical protein